MYLFFPTVKNKQLMFVISKQEKRGELEAKMLMNIFYFNNPV